MSIDFRNAVFRLCRKLSLNTESKRIRQTIHNFSVAQNDKYDSGVIEFPSHGSLAYMATQQKAQFLGYLIADDSVEDINRISPFKATNLTNEERTIIEMAHNTFQFFINKCTEELQEKYPKAYLLIDPYGLYKKTKFVTASSSFLEMKDIQECINSFRSGKLYKKIIDNDALEFFEELDESEIKDLCIIQKKQLMDDYRLTTKETDDFLRRLRTNIQIEAVDLLMIYSIYCYALKESLFIALQMLYDSILGHDLTVMTNDNIIRIVDRHSDVVYEKYIVLLQGDIYDIAGGGVGSIALLSCDPSENDHIKSFGIIWAQTVSFANEFGDTTKVTLVTVDEELNGIHLLTDNILNTNIGKLPVHNRKK